MINLPTDTSIYIQTQTCKTQCMHKHRPQVPFTAHYTERDDWADQSASVTYISHLVNLLEAGLQEGLEDSAVRGNHNNTELVENMFLKNLLLHYIIARSPANISITQC